METLWQHYYFLSAFSSTLGGVVRIKTVFASRLFSFIVVARNLFGSPYLELRYAVYCDSYYIPILVSLLRGAWEMTNRTDGLRIDHATTKVQREKQPEGYVSVATKRVGFFRRRACLPYVID